MTTATTKAPTVYQPSTLKPLPPYGRFVSLTEVDPLGKETNINIDNSQRNMKQILNSTGDQQQSDLFNAVLLALLAKEQGGQQSTGPEIVPGLSFVGSTGDAYDAVARPWSGSDYTFAPTELPTIAPSSPPFDLSGLSLPTAKPSSGTSAKRYVAAAMTLALSSIAAVTAKRGDDRRAVVFGALAIASALVA